MTWGAAQRSPTASRAVRPSLHRLYDQDSVVYALPFSTMCVAHSGAGACRGRPVHRPNASLSSAVDFVKRSYEVETAPSGADGIIGTHMMGSVNAAYQAGSGQRRRGQGHRV